MSAIYGLIDPRTGDLRYIGKADDAEKRFATHLRDSRRRDTPVYRWIRKLYSLGHRPDMLVLSECEDWETEERRLIASARARGYRLLNVADGGDQPVCSREVCAQNARLLNERRRNDPVFAELYTIVRRAGQTLKWCRDRGDQKRVAQFEPILERLKEAIARDPQGVYERMIARRARKALEKDNGSPQ